MQNKFLSHTLAALLAAATLSLAGCGGGSSSSSSSSSGDAVVASSLATPDTPARTIPETLAALPSNASAVQDVSQVKAYRKVPGLTPLQVVLPAMDAPVLQKSAGTPRQGQPVQIGAAREIVATASDKDTVGQLLWTSTGNGGQIAALRVKSTGAKGLRLGVQVTSLPVAAVLRFRATSRPDALEISAAEILAVIQRNQDAGDTSVEARTYWSPDLGGDEVTLEIELPPGGKTEAVQIAVPRLSHVYVQLPAKETIQAKIGEAGSCNRDVPCNPAYDDDSRSVARMRFVNAGSSYLCTGTLLNNTALNSTPYFLSAYHCISDQTTASTLTTDWLYRSSACNSGAVSPAATTLRGGATMLYAAPGTDTAFMRLNTTPPPGVKFAGWSAAQPSLGSAVLGLHHPAGDVQKYSTGTLQSFANCTTSSCSPGTAQTGTHVALGWNDGVTEGGSSGSGLFASSGGPRYLIGQLTGGTASCANPSGFDVYGRFDLAYRAALSQWLAPAPLPVAAGQRSPVYRFYNTVTATHFYTASVAERDTVAASYPQFTYEGIAFYAYAGSSAGTSPVFRFYNNRTSAHFYTINAEERSFVQTNYPWFTDEGTRWFANNTATAGSTPLYRLYNNATATHFYTVNAAERDSVIKTYPQFAYEGVGYHVWNAQ